MMQATAELNHSQQKDVYNVLIIGETGVGKSTWVNAFANYMQFTLIAEAKRNPQFPIPAGFRHVDPQTFRESTYVQTDENELGPHDARSSTRLPTIYKFDFRDHVLNLIDTPGIRDTRGDRCDEENIMAVFDVLRSVEKLHAVCILLKNNETRMTAEFQERLNMLLSNLHEDMCVNVVFCLTFSFGEDFKPGQTLSTLRNYIRDNGQLRLKLEPKTLYCVDNYAVEYLSKTANNFNVTDDEVRRAERCWAESSASMSRLVAYVKQLAPLPVFSLVSVYDTKRKAVIVGEAVVELVKLVANDTATLQQKCEDIDEKRQAIMRSPAREHYQLMELLMAYVSQLMTKMFNTPVVQCSSVKCLERGPCDDKCVASFVTSIICSTDPKRKELCTTCKCPYENHEWQTSKFSSDKVTVLKHKVADRALSKDEAIIALTEQRDTIAKYISDLLDENGQLVDTCAKISIFVQRNGLLKHPGNMSNGSTTHTDVISRLLEREIQRLVNDGDMELLAAVRETRKRYTEAQTRYKNQYYEAADVCEMMKELFNLKLKGSELKNAIDGYDAARAKAIRDIRQVVVELLCRSPVQESLTSRASARN